MSYVDAYLNKAKDIIHVAERVDGKRIIQDINPEYNFYILDPKGKQQTIHGQSVTEVRSKNGKDFKKNVAINQHNTTFESDLHTFLNQTL